MDTLNAPPDQHSVCTGGACCAAPDVAKPRLRVRLAIFGALAISVAMAAISLLADSVALGGFFVFLVGVPISATLLFFLFKKAPCKQAPTFLEGLIALSAGTLIQSKTFALNLASVLDEAPTMALVLWLCLPLCLLYAGWGLVLLSALKKAAKSLAGTKPV